MTLGSLLGAGRGATMTSFFSPEFFVLFLPLAVLVYALVPNRAKKYWLLCASYLFYWFVSGALIVYLLASTISIHYFGIWLDRVQTEQKEALASLEKEKRKEEKKRFQKKQRRIVLMAVILHIGVLLFVKYSGFFATNVNNLFSVLNVSVAIRIPEYLMPIGISFFSLQALSYIFDVYHGVTKADGNICRLALFLAFFPQIVEGPICRYSQTAEQLWDAKQITYRNLTRGSQRFLFGIMKKMVVADRLNSFVALVFNDYGNCDGGVIALGAVLYTVQLYMDFSGSMDAVIGTAEIFGLRMPENFERPFFSKTISEFWKRWHITLGAWFRDYMFYPVTASDGMKKLTSSARKKIGNHYGPLLAGSIALFCVWFSNGLWHGSDWNYIFFGLYHFFLILLGNLIAPPVKWLNRKLHLKPEAFAYRLLQMIRTSVLVVIGELFFRAEGLSNGLRMFRKMVTQFSFSSFTRAFFEKCGLGLHDLAIVGVTLVIVFAVSLWQEKKGSVRELIGKRNVAIRWTVWYALILFIVIFGAYGFGYAPVDPIYAQF